MVLVIDHVRGLPGAKELLTSYVPGEGNPSPFYYKLGFEETGEIEDVEKVLRLELYSQTRLQFSIPRHSGSNTSSRKQ